MENVLELNNISKKFDTFKLKNISFSLKKGNIMGLIGNNGSGKTTTIKLILNMLTPTNGKIKIFNQDYIQNEIYLKEKIGVVFDTSYFVNEWTLKEVNYLFKNFYENWNENLFESFCNKFNLSKNKQIKQFSKGMQMKLMIACAFSYDAKLLILDEPTSGLDPASRDELLDIILNYVKSGECSVLFSTHITSDLSKIADDITFLNDGQIFYSGKKDNFVESFKIVTGNINNLNINLENQMIGYKKNDKYFTGLIKNENIKNFSNANFSNASLDDIIIYTNKGGENIGRY